MANALTVYAPAATVAELRQLVRLATLLILVVFGVFGLWAVFSSINGAVVASGVVKVEVDPKLIQHPEGGIVRSIKIREGQHVKRGDILLELDDVEADAGLAIVRDQLDAEKARMARLTAESRDARAVEFPQELLARRGESAMSGILKREQELFAARGRLFREQQSNLVDQRKGAQEEYDSLTRQIGSIDESLLHLGEQEKMYASLTEQKFFSPAKMHDVRRMIAESQSTKHEAESKRAQAAQKISDLRMRLDSLRANFLADISRDLVESQTKVLGLQEKLKPAQQSRERTLVRAPEAGTVNLLKVHTVGGAIGPREPLVEITPDETRLVAEVHINPNDKDSVTQGLDTEVELVGLPRRTTPMVPGKVEFVSPDLVTDPANPQSRYFVARVTMGPPQNVTLVPGMPVTTFIKTQSRSPLDLWIDPMVGFVRKSMRER
jgi:HlyD family secretion protein